MSWAVSSWGLISHLGKAECPSAAMCYYSALLIRPGPVCIPHLIGELGKLPMKGPIYDYVSFSKW